MAGDMWGGVVQGVGGIASAFMASKGQKEANEANIAMANASNATAREIAQKQMDFQERMSSTAHQREVKDLEAAGLNPILSVTGGSGASSPSGVSAPVTTPSVDSNYKDVPTSAAAVS